MRYIFGLMMAAVLMMVSADRAQACDMRGEIRDEIRSNFGSIHVEMDAKELEDRLHEMVHAKLDREKERLKEERQKLRDERRRLERERRRVSRERRDYDRDDESSGWGASLLLALGLYGVGALILSRRNRKNNGNTE